MHPSYITFMSEHCHRIYFCIFVFFFIGEIPANSTYYTQSDQRTFFSVLIFVKSNSKIYVLFVICYNFQSTMKSTALFYYSKFIYLFVTARVRSIKEMNKMTANKIIEDRIEIK